MKETELTLTDLHQVTTIAYDSDTTRVRMEIGYLPDRRHTIPLQNECIGGALGLKLLLEIMKAATGRPFIHIEGNNLYLRNDTPEVTKMLAAAHPQQSCTEA